MTGEGYHGVHKTLVERLGARRGETVYTFFTCLLALGVSGLIAYASGRPLLFPSLGPTALLFFEQPTAKTASPRNTLIGHAVAIVAGAISLAVFGLLTDASVLREGVTLARAGAGALSVALTGAVLLLLRASHPPTGATTLIVSLGFLQTPPEMAALMVGVVDPHRARLGDQPRPGRPGTGLGLQRVRPEGCRDTGPGRRGTPGGTPKRGCRARWQPPASWRLRPR